MAALTSSRSRVIVGILVLVALYTASYQYHSHHKLNFDNLGIDTYKLVPSFLKSSKYDFASQALEHEVSDPFNVTAISDLCLNRPPRDDVIITCNPGTGGVGNIRSYILHCTRFAMETGASMILPNFHRRSTSDLAELLGPIGDFEYFFDRQHYTDTIQLACPHMRIYEHPEGEWTLSNMEIPHWQSAINISSVAQPSAWRRQFDEWIEEKTATMKKPVIVASGDPGRERAVMDDGVDFYYAVGRILRFRPDTRRLAALCMAEISSRFNLNMEPEQRIFENAYLGAHLRTSSDAVKAGWNPDFDGQSDWYLNQALQHNLNVIFAAGGNDADLARFAEKASKQGIAVVNKYDLLFGNDRRELNNLLWDQRALVDFEVLLKASQFGGYGRSSFSLNVAARRHFLSIVNDPYSDAENHFVDELSVVYGRFDANWDGESERTMWP